MDVPTEVLVHNALLGMKGTAATLIQISADGYYELNCRFGQELHRLLLPIAETALIARDAEEVFETESAIER